MLLRLTQHEERKGREKNPQSRHRVEIRVEGDGAPQSAESLFPFEVTAQDEADLRWYLEDFLERPQDPSPAIARRVEARMQEIGEELFRGVFQGSEEARDLWAQVRNGLADLRVEVATEVAEAASLPWELLRDPATGFALATTAQAFVRAQPRSRLKARLVNATDGPVRILVVLCRPRAAEDVPFRSVASWLIKGLEAEHRAVYDLDFLRPPTFEQLGRVLRKAKKDNRPYHVVHFDGHGAYRQAPEGKATATPWSRILMTSPGGKHGFLAFENPALAGNEDLVSGADLGRLLFEADVPVLVLNACRSAYNEAPATPEKADGNDHTSQVRAFGSLAQEVMAAGVGGVVAMRYNVYVVTAAQMVAELYASLAQGRFLGEAVTLARKNLADNPLRDVLSQEQTLQDWPVPVVYEAAPLRIFPEAREVEVPTFQVERKVGGTGGGEEAGALPPPPDVGFYGRDETLLALDRAFDRDRIVLLHAYAGSGKTTTAVEFARWYLKTGGVDLPPLFTRFEQYLPLARVLDVVGQVFAPYLESGGVHWLTLDDAQRRDVALQLLTQVPVLWVWDNVEPVAGFPAGTPSAWSTKEQQELADFLRALQGTQAKVLLTSRREEREWLGDLPTRVRVPAMPMLERLQLARAIAGKQGRTLAEVDWRPLLAFTEGNPLALKVVVGQALREGLRSQKQIEGFVAKLRTGEVEFADEAGEGRSKPLGASLAYGFEQAFGEEERRRLAVLALFQGFVDVDALRTMGNPKVDWSLAEVRGLGREEWITLLDRAAEVGLLTAHVGGYYGIHPALPWFFRGLFERFYPQGGRAALRAWVEAVGGLGDYYFDQYESGHRDVIGALGAEEANLLHVRRLAREHGWWAPVTSAMQGLRQLYDHTGRRAEWQRLVEEIVPDFVDPASGGPLPGREEEWGLVADYRVRMAIDERRWAEAERLQGRMVEGDREQAAGGLVLEPGELEAGQRNRFRNLAVSLSTLGYIRRELGRADCVPAYEEALDLAERFGDRAGAAARSFNLGHVYKDLPALRDLHQAERWYRRSLELYEDTDRVGRASCAGQLGLVALERFKEARAANRPVEELLGHLNQAARQYHEALDLLPSDEIVIKAVVHSQLGSIYGRAGDLDRALPHYRQSIQLMEAQGDLYGAAQTRFNVAFHLHSTGRGADALEYARAALRGFESFGDRAAEMIERSRGLIAEIQA
jgi:tetratricopeptide (TPR) repeat protein